MSQSQDKPRHGSPKPGHRWAQRRRVQAETWYDYGRQCWVDFSRAPWQETATATVATCGHHDEVLDAPPTCYACQHGGEPAERRSGLDRRGGAR